MKLLSAFLVLQAALSAFGLPVHVNSGLQRYEAPNIGRLRLIPIF